MDLGVPEIGLILLAVFVLFGYKKLPDATRSLGRSLRIFKGEMEGMKDDDTRAGAPPSGPAADAAVGTVAGPAVVPAQLKAAAAEAEALALEALAFEALAFEARARADAERAA